MDFSSSFLRDIYLLPAAVPIANGKATFLATLSWFVVHVATYFKEINFSSHLLNFVFEKCI